LIRPLDRGSDYAELSRQVRAAGLLARRPGYYRARIALVLMLLTVGWTAFALLGPSWWQVAVAAFLAVMFTQVGFLGHDAGHRQVFGSRRANDLLGLLCANVLIGLSYRWWVDKHNRHHAHPNHVGRDPDIAAGGIAFTPAQVRARRSSFGRWIARHQAALFLPMLLFEGMALHLASVRALAGRCLGRGHRSESVLLLAHACCYLTAVFAVLPPGRALAFIAVHQGLFGFYLGCSFAPNHKGMPSFGPETKLDYLRRQVLTSRNVRGGRLVDVLLGGLDYQIEHHLFPSMPSVNLGRAQPLVREFCRERHLPYAESTLAGSYARVLGHLREVGSTGRCEPSGREAALRGRSPGA
jgi:fatty acid desaturase